VHLKHRIKTPTMLGI